MTNALITIILDGEITRALSDVTVVSIIKWYGTLCLATLPISLVAMIYIYMKRPDKVSAFDKAIDRLVDGKPEKEKPAETEKSKSETPAESTVKTDEEANEKIGIPNMILQVGDKYQCYLSSKNRSDVLGGNFSWGTDNPFVGDITEFSGIFTAKKVGKTYIECGAKQVRIYYAQVMPNNRTWFGYYPINDVLSKIDAVNVKTREIKRKIIGFEPENGTLSYTWSPGKLTYQMNGKDQVVKALFILPDNDEVLVMIRKEVSEYMELLETGDTVNGLYWVHLSGLDEDFPESVDYTAFLRKSKRGDYYFGIGESWRPGASKKEIQENTGMILRSFKELLDWRDVPATVGTTLTENENTDEVKPAENNNPVRKNTKIDTVKNNESAEDEAPADEIKDTNTIDEKDVSDTEDNNENMEDEEILIVEDESTDPFADFSEEGESEYRIHSESDINSHEN